MKLFVKDELKHLWIFYVERFLRIPNLLEERDDFGDIEIVPPRGLKLVAEHIRESLKDYLS